MLYLINAQDDHFRQESGSIIHKFFINNKIPSKLIVTKPLKTVRKLASSLNVPDDSIETIYDFLLGNDEEVINVRNLDSILNIDNTWEIDKTGDRNIEYRSIDGKIVFKVDFFDSAATTIKEIHKFIDGNLELVYEFEDRGYLWAQTKHLENKKIIKKLFHRNGEAVLEIEEKSHKIQKVRHLTEDLIFYSEISFIGWAVQKFLKLKKRDEDRFIVTDIPTVHKALMETNIAKDALYLLIDKSENMWKKLKLDIEEPFVYERYTGIIFNTQEESMLYSDKLYKKSFVPISWVNYASVSPKQGKKMETDLKKVYIKIPETLNESFLLNLSNQLYIAQKEGAYFKYLIEAHSVRQTLILKEFFGRYRQSLDVEIVRTSKYELLENIVSELWCYVCLDESLTVDFAVYISLSYGVPIVSLNTALFNHNLVTNKNGIRVSLARIGEAIATLGKSVDYYEIHLSDIEKIQMNYSPSKTIKRWEQILNMSLKKRRGFDDYLSDK